MKVFKFAVITALAGCTSSDALSSTTLSLEEEDVLVIRQVYGGGGNQGALLKHDFVELFNAGSEPLSLAGLSVQYAPSSGSFGTNSGTISELPDVKLAPGQSFLLLAAQGSGGSVELLPADLMDNTPLALSGSAGRVVLVEGATGLNCGSVAEPCDMASLERIVDLVGYGSGTTRSEGTPTRALSATTAAIRKRSGCEDTDNNVADFEIATPAPRNMQSPLTPCSEVVDPDPADEPDAGTPVTEDPGKPGNTRIHDIQGAAHRSPLVGAELTNVEGVVTALSERGFWFQDPTPDADPATSEGLFVFTANAPSVRVGDRIYVSGRVAEFRPACASCSATSNAFDNLTTTQLSNVSKIVVVAAGDALPAPVRIGPSGRMPPLSRVKSEGSTGDVEVNGSPFDVVRDGLDFHESLEGMRVALEDAVASGRTHDFRTSQEVCVSVPGARSRLSARGGLLLGELGHGDDQQPERFHVSSLLTDYRSFPKLNVGDRFASELVGIVDYSFGKFLLLATKIPPVIAGDLVRETVSLPKGNAPSLDVATFNVENLGGDAAQERFDAMAKVVVDNLGSPDLLVLEEVQDDNGATNDSVTRSDLTISRLTQAIAAATGPAYAYRDIAPLDDTNGGQPGGNIRVGFLFRTDRGLAFVDRTGGDAITSTTVTNQNGVPQLSASPGLIAPQSSAFVDSRKPLVAELTFAGETLFVVGNHWNSKGGDDPTFGRFQPPVRSSEVQRKQQAELVTSFVEEILAIDPKANVLVLGDLNDFRYSESVSLLVERAKLTHLIDTLPESERYGYVYQGVSQLLDHVLTSSAMAQRLVGFDVVHFNAEFADQLSDHDPSVARFTFSESTPDDDDDDDGMNPEPSPSDAGMGDASMPPTPGNPADAGMNPDRAPDAGSPIPDDDDEGTDDVDAGLETETDTDPITGRPTGEGKSKRSGCSVLPGEGNDTAALLGLLLAGLALWMRRRPALRE